MNMKTTRRKKRKTGAKIPTLAEQMSHEIWSGNCLRIEETIDTETLKLYDAGIY